MKLYTEEQVKKAIDLARVTLLDKSPYPKYIILSEIKGIELPSDEEIIGRFMNWFLKHYSTATIDGMFGYVNSMEQEVTIKEILDDYLNQNT